MRKLFVIATLMLASSVAFAADLPRKSAPYIAPAAPPSWTGFYVGINGGGG